VADHQSLLTTLARIDTVTWLASEMKAPESAIAFVGDLRLLIPLAGLIDKDAELKRLSKEIDKLRKELEKSTTKLNNPQFMERAPADIVAKEQQRIAEMTASLQQLETQAAKIRQL
jgi:valyl-tRNA synthetase